MKGPRCPESASSAADAAELADLLRFLGEWLAADHDRLGGSLAQFMGDHAYGVKALQHDLARFRSLLGVVDEGENVFLPRARAGHQRAPGPTSTVGGQATLLGARHGYRADGAKPVTSCTRLVPD